VFGGGALVEGENVVQACVLVGRGGMRQPWQGGAIDKAHQLIPIQKFMTRCADTVDVEGGTVVVVGVGMCVGGRVCSPGRGEPLTRHTS
jgi:hypothetical protein